MNDIFFRLSGWKGFPFTTGMGKWEMVIWTCKRPATACERRRNMIRSWMVGIWRRRAVSQVQKRAGGGG